jgi:hypothetical protein
MGNMKRELSNQFEELILTVENERKKKRKYIQEWLINNDKNMELMCQEFGKWQDNEKQELKRKEVKLYKRKKKALIRLW